MSSLANMVSPASINMKPVPWSSLTMAAPPMSQQNHPPSKVHKFPGSYKRAADPTESRRTGCCFRAAGQGIPATQRWWQVGRQVVEIDFDSRFLMLPVDMWKIIENPMEAPETKMERKDNCGKNPYFVIDWPGMQVLLLQSSLNRKQIHLQAATLLFKRKASPQIGPETTTFAATSSSDVFSFYMIFFWNSYYLHVFDAPTKLTFLLLLQHLDIIGFPNSIPTIKTTHLQIKCQLEEATVVLNPVLMFIVKASSSWWSP